MRDSVAWCDSRLCGVVLLGVFKVQDGVVNILSISFGYFIKQVLMGPCAAHVGV